MDDTVHCEADAFEGEAERCVSLPPVSNRAEAEAAIEGESASEDNPAGVDARCAEDDGLTEEERAAKRRCDEQAFLGAVFDDVRKRSASGLLTVPSRWQETGIVPEHMTAEDAEMFVYDWLEDYRKRAAAEPKPERPVFRSATRAVGIPRRFDPQARAEDEARERAAARAKASDADGETAPAKDADKAPLRVRDGVAGTDDGLASMPSGNGAAPVERERVGLADLAAAHEASAAPASVSVARPPAVAGGLDSVALADDRGADEEFEPFELTVRGVRGVVKLVDGEPTFVPIGPVEAEAAVDATRIKLLQGRGTYYLYAEDKMTDNFANWAFMAAEDDDAAVLVALARQESRVYPRPFHDASLKNFPFLFDDARIDAAWKSVQESGAYPDVRETFASNGDRYFYSTDFLSPRRARGLAEYRSVTVYENM